MRLIDHISKYLNVNQNVEIVDLNSIEIFKKLRLSSSSSSLFSTTIKIPMKINNNTNKFQSEEIMDIIVSNLIIQEINLDASSWREIIKFFYSRRRSGEFSTKREEQIKLESLMILSTLKVEDLNEYFNPRPNRTFAFCRRVDCWTNRCNGKWMPWVINRADGDELLLLSLKIKNFLRLDCIVTVLEICLNDCFLKIDKIINAEWILKEIDEMNIYLANDLRPFKGLCLLDGFLISENRLVNLFSSTIPEVGDADLFSLSCQLCAHYLARVLIDDYNFSLLSPCDIDNPQKLYYIAEKKYSPIIINGDKFRRIGRSVEYVLFDNRQPCWYNSNTKIAQEFIRRINNQNYSLPLFPKSENNIHGDLCDRRMQSFYFAADLGEDEGYAGAIFD